MKKLLLTALLLLTTNAHATIIEIEFNEMKNLLVWEAENYGNGNASFTKYYTPTTPIYIDRIEIAENSSGTYTYSEQVNSHHTKKVGSRSYDNTGVSLNISYLNELNEYTSGDISDDFGDMKNGKTEVSYVAELDVYNDGRVEGVAGIRYSQTFSHSWFDASSGYNIFEYLLVSNFVELETFSSQKEFDLFKSFEIHEAVSRVNEPVNSDSYLYFGRSASLPCVAPCVSNRKNFTQVQGGAIGSQVSVTQVNEPSILILLLTATLFVLRRRFK